MLQKDFADRVFVSASYISKVESGKEIPSDIFVKLVALEFEISYTWLKKGIGEMEKQMEYRLEFQVKKDSIEIYMENWNISITGKEVIVTEMKDGIVSHIHMDIPKEAEEKE